MPWNKRICSKCISDSFLKELINQRQEESQACSYCSSICPTINMLSLAKMCDKVIDNFFEDTADENSLRFVDSDYFYDSSAEGDDLRVVLASLLGAPSEAIEYLVEILKSFWFDINSFEYKHASTLFIEKSSLKWDLSRKWREIEESLRHDVRYFNSKAFKLFEEVFGSILGDRTQQGDNVFIELGEGSGYDVLYRARVFQTRNAIEKAFEHPERHFGPPPPGLGSQGRMNAKGVPVFYASTKPGIAISEVRPTVGSHVVVAQFKIKRPLRVLDLRRLGTICGKSDLSKFHPDSYKQASRIDFLRDLTRNIIQPVVPELEDVRYVVTQAIADFLAVHPKLNLDGIMFPSAQHSGNAEKLGCNVALFAKASDVLYTEECYGKRTQVSLFDKDIDLPQSTLVAEISTRNYSPRENIGEKLKYALSQNREASLVLIRDAITIVTIKGVKYEFNTQTVRHSADKIDLGDLNPKKDL